MMLLKEKCNSLFFAFFFMQYGLLTPFIFFTGPDIPIISCSLIIVLISLYINRNCIRTKQIIIPIIVILLLLIQFFIFPLYVDGLIKIIVTFLSIGISSIWIGSCKIDYKIVYKYLVKFSYINFICNCLTPFTPFYLVGEMSQMRFAYAILPSVIVCLVEILKGRRLVIHIIITLIVITELFVYGSRGAFISIILLFVISVIYLKLSAIKKCLIIGSMLLCLFFLNYGVIVLERILDNTSIETPAFNRYRTFLKKGIVDSSSGRDEIYSKAWNMFSDSPILGCGIGYFPSKMNMDFTVRFVHNFFIQIFFEYGIILAIIIYSFLLSLMVKMYRNGDNVLVMNILVILLSVVCGRLMVSSSYWARPEFWLMLSYMWMYKKNRYTL